MAWVLVVVAGFFEAGFAISLKASDGFSRLVPSVLFLLFGGASFTLLSIGLKSLPIGPAYAVWTGLGALSTAVIGIVFLSEGARRSSWSRWRSCWPGSWACSCRAPVTRATAVSDVEPAGRPLTVKGAERRAALVAAGGALFLESGTEGFTHRAVARRAAVPLSATTYYFDSLQDLLVESVIGLCEGWVDALVVALAVVPRRLSRAALARTAVGLTLVGPGATEDDEDELAGERRAVAFYQRSVEAGRHPGSGRRCGS